MQVKISAVNIKIIQDMETDLEVVKKENASPAGRIHQYEVSFNNSKTQVGGRAAERHCSCKEV